MGGKNDPWKCTENLIFLGSRKKDWKFRWAETSSFYAYLTWWLLRFFFEDTLFLGTKTKRWFLFFQLEAYLCLNSRYGSLDFSTPGVLVWKRWMLITTFAQKNPHKITDTCGSGLQWFHQTDPDGLKIPERNKKWCLATRVRICSNFPFFVCKRRCVCVCVVVVFPTKKSYECDENLFPGRPVEFNSLPIHMLHGFVFSQERMSRVYHFATTDLVPCSLFAKKRYYTICHNREWNSDFEHMIGIPTLASSWE